MSKFRQFLLFETENCLFFIISPSKYRVTDDQPSASVWQYENEWSHPLHDICSNKKLCCCGFFCYFCFICERELILNGKKNDKLKIIYYF